MKRILPIAMLLAAACAATSHASLTDGVIVLEARAAKISGGSARYDGAAGYQCIRHWNSTNNAARWTFEVPARGSYRVVVNYASPSECQGSVMEVTAAGQRLEWYVRKTVDWFTYSEEDIGPLLIRKPGPIELVLQATRCTRAGAWDLRAIKLVPVR